MRATPDERARIREAMERIFDGTPLCSTGALTIVALAQEAGVPTTRSHSGTPTSATSSTSG